MAKPTPTKSRTPFYGLLLLLGIAGAVGIWYAMRANQTKPITLDAVAMANLPKAEGYLRGNPDAPITIIEFGDFECGGCGQFALLEEPEIRARIIEPGLANFRYFDYPLPNHMNSLAASLAASCAADQGKFWEMHDAIFAGQDQWNSQATTNPRKVLDGYAGTLGLDMKVYGECYSSQKNLPRIQAHKAAGDARGVNQTPTLVIGDQVYPGGLRFDGLKRIIDSMTAAMPTKPSADTARK